MLPRSSFGSRSALLTQGLKGYDPAAQLRPCCVCVCVVANPQGLRQLPIDMMGVRASSLWQSLPLRTPPSPAALLTPLQAMPNLIALHAERNEIDVISSEIADLRLLGILNLSRNRLKALPFYEFYYVIDTFFSCEKFRDIFLCHWQALPIEIKACDK
jgi:hypothetical protein